MSAILFVDNLFSPFAYPDLVLTANEEASDHEAEFFSTLRREDAWSPTTFNNDAWLKATHTQVRGFNTVCLWVHNLLGEAYKFQISDDDFTTTQTVIDVTIPLYPGTGDIDDALGVVTEDFMWMKRVSTRYAKYFRHYVPAMGANLKPELAGIAGVSTAFDRDRGDLVDANDFQAEQARSHRGVVGQGEADVSRGGSVPVTFPSLFAYEEFRFHLQRYDGTATGTPIPGLLIFDEARAEQAVMVRRPVGRMGFRQAQAFYPSGELLFQEHDHA